MLFLLFFLQFTFVFLSNVAALNITLQFTTIVGQPSLVLWAREPSDGNGLLVFDLRIIKLDNEDIGLALANIQAQPSSQFGTGQVVFKSPGSYLVVAVSGPDYTRIGQSGQVNAFQVPPPSISKPTSVPSATSSAKPTSTSSAKPTSTSSAAGRKKNLGAIIGGTLGGVAFLGILAALVIVFIRRRRQPTEDNKSRSRRWTFHRDKMILPPVLDIRRTTPMDTEFYSPYDIEQQQQVVGIPHLNINDNIPSTSPVVTMASPRGLQSPKRPLPLPPVPLIPHQVDKAAQMEQIRNQIAELEKKPGPTQHIILEDLQIQLNWLKSQN